MVTLLRHFPSLSATLAAGLLAGALLGGAAFYGNKLERHNIHRFTWELAREQDIENEGELTHGAAALPPCRGAD